MKDPDPNQPDMLPYSRDEGAPPVRSFGQFLLLCVYAVIALVAWVAAAIGATSNVFPRPVRLGLSIIAAAPIVGWLLYMALEALGVLLDVTLGIKAFIGPLSRRKKIAGVIVMSILIVAFFADRFWLESNKHMNRTTAAPAESHPASSPATTGPAGDLNRLINHSPIILPANGAK